MMMEIDACTLHDDGNGLHDDPFGQHHPQQDITQQTRVEVFGLPIISTTKVQMCNPIVCSRLLPIEAGILSSSSVVLINSFQDES
jgi:hypothetical protein